MRLVVHELGASGLVQVIRSPKNALVVAVRPHLYRHNFATGNLKIQVLDESDVLLAESETLDIADLTTDSDNPLAYFHGFVRFDVSVGMKKDTVYKIKLVGGGGYSFGESAYIGWCNAYDNGHYTADYVPTNDLYEPLDLEIWDRKSA